MNIFEYAMQMEKDGENYYRQLAQQTANKGLKTILTMLADEEVKHYNAIEKIQTATPHIAEEPHFARAPFRKNPRNGSPKSRKMGTQTIILTDVNNVFAQLKESNESFDFDIRQTELYRKAQDIEKRSLDFYTEKANEVAEEYHKELFLKLADEEKKHYFLLDNIIEFVSRPETWLENAEFYHLDEY